MSAKLKGLNFVVTGVLEGFTRNGVDEFITANGGIMLDSVQRKTNYLVVGDKPGASKLRKADEFGVKNIVLEDLMKMVK
jgi:DNA ligase (NAD+)